MLIDTLKDYNNTNCILCLMNYFIIQDLKVIHRINAFYEYISEL